MVAFGLRSDRCVRLGPITAFGTVPLTNVEISIGARKAPKVHPPLPLPDPALEDGDVDFLRDLEEESRARSKKAHSSHIPFGDGPGHLLLDAIDEPDDLAKDLEAIVAA